MYGALSMLYLTSRKPYDYFNLLANAAAQILQLAPIKVPE